MDTAHIEQARNETPACRKLIHFNNAGAALQPGCVIKAVLDHLERENQSGGYEAAHDAHETIEATYTAIANLINAKENEIAVVENATRAWDMAFYALLFKPGDRILTARAEYASNYIAYLQTAKRTGANIEVIPDDEHGQLCVNSLRNMIDNRVKLISITHVPTNGGLVNPAAEVGKIARDNKILFLLDACQSVGQMPIDVRQLGCHILSATGRKYLRGPRGTGFLYVDESLIESLEPPFLDLHAASWIAENQYEIRNDARRFENWETNFATKIGLGEAARYAAKQGLEAIWTRVQHLGSMMRKQLALVPGVSVHDKGLVRGGIVTFTHDRFDASTIQKRLREHMINTSVSPLAYARLDMQPRGLSAMVRASLHYYNTEDEIDRFCKVLTRLTSAQGTRA